jgi:hypothetical protein
MASPTINPSTKKNRPFWQRYLILMAVDSLVVFGLAAVLLVLGGSNQVSNFFFLSSGVFFVVAVIPIFSEVGGNLRVAGKALKGEEAEKLVKAQSDKSKSGARTTYLFGLAGLTTFILALVFI